MARQGTVEAVPRPWSVLRVCRFGVTDVAWLVRPAVGVVPGVLVLECE